MNNRRVSSINLVEKIYKVQVNEINDLFPEVIQAVKEAVLGTVYESIVTIKVVDVHIDENERV